MGIFYANVPKLFFLDDFFMNLAQRNQIFACLLSPCENDFLDYQTDYKLCFL